MLNHYARNWWAVTIRGVLAVLFGVLALLLPTLTLGVLTIIFGAYILFDGLFNTFSSIAIRKTSQSWWALLIEGLVGIVAGAALIAFPAFAAVAFLFLIAAWAVITGVLEILTAIQLRKEIKNEWLLGLGGILSILLGVLAFSMPGAALIAVIWLVAFYAVIFGVVLIALSFRLRSYYQLIKTD